MRKVIVIIFIFSQLAVYRVMAFTPTYKFNDKPQDPFSKIYDYGSRQYDSDLGRFIQPDPLQNFLVTPELEKKTGIKLEAVLANPQRLNTYSYALNNPINVIDPTGESPKVSEERKSNFDTISDYIRKDEKYWLIRDRDGNAKALDAIWNKCLELSKDNRDKALEVFYDAVHIDWAHDKVLDKSYEDFIDRYNNLPSSLGGEYGGSNLQRDKLQHFAASARLANKYGGWVANLLGKAKETKDGIRAMFRHKSEYSKVQAADEGYSQRDIAANQAGILWSNEYKQGKTMPSDIINNLY